MKPLSEQRNQGAKLMSTLSSVPDRKPIESVLEHKELRNKYAKLVAIGDIQDTRIGDVNMIVRNK